MIIFSPRIYRVAVLAGVSLLVGYIALKWSVRGELYIIVLSPVEIVNLPEALSHKLLLYILKRG